MLNYDILEDRIVKFTRAIKTGKAKNFTIFTREVVNYSKGYINNGLEVEYLKNATAKQKNNFLEELNHKKRSNFFKIYVSYDFKKKKDIENFLHDYISLSYSNLNKNSNYLLLDCYNRFLRYVND